MDVWSDASLERDRGAVILKSMLERGWLSHLISRRRNFRAGASSMDFGAKNGEWSRRIQALNEECEALRRKLQLSA